MVDGNGKYGMSGHRYHIQITNDCKLFADDLKEKIYTRRLKI